MVYRFLNTLVIACLLGAFFVPAHGATYNQLKYMRYCMEQGREVQPQQIKVLLQQINEIGDKRLTVDPSVVADLQERLAQSSSLLRQYNQLLAHLSRELGKEAFESKKIMEAIQRLKIEREVMQRERDEARRLLGDLADFAEDLTEE